MPASPIPSKIEQVLLRAGDHVKQGEAILQLHRLIRIADAGEKGPAGLLFLPEFAFQDLGKVDLHLHKAPPGGLGVVPAVAAHKDRVAIAAAVPAAQVGIDDERDAGDFGPDQRGLGGDFGYIHESAPGAWLMVNYIII